MCVRTIGADLVHDQMPAGASYDITDTWAGAQVASAELLRRIGELKDPATDQEAAEEVALLAATLVAYACVPGGHHAVPEDVEACLLIDPAAD